MITKILIKNEASFNNEGAELTDLKKINYIYGANASGKTTITKVIANEGNYLNCKIDWENNIKIDTVVYNQDFKEKNYNQNNELQGIFTLGENNKLIIDDIEKKKKEIDEFKSNNIRLNITLEQNNKSLEEEENAFETKCWDLKHKYDNDFKVAFKGFRNSKNRFKEKCKSESKNISQLKFLEELINESKTIFEEEVEKVSEIININYEFLDSLESDTILKTKIIGKEDVNIAAMIKKLKNSDWVKQGLSYYEMNNNICPFCQQTTTDEFKNQLEEYFDETYINQLEAVRIFENKYISKIQNILVQLDLIIKEDNKYLDTQIIITQRDILTSKFNNNKNFIKNKLKEPSLSIEIESLNENFKIINNSIEDSIKKIIKHNNYVRNIKKEKIRLTSEVWRFVIEENKNESKNYLLKINNLNNAVNTIQGKIKINDDNIKINEEAISNLEKQITSIKPTKDAINKILSSFDFKNFSLEESEKEGYYKIIRENGEDAKDTLSEGEENFISFLYFYNLLKGGFNNEEITKDKIVVFDDPVSSLDSNVLFIVSSLIKEIISNIIKNQDNIKQLYIFTHNIYFHKKVSFDSHRGEKSRKFETFWIIRKINNISKIKFYPYNPIKTSYELLWHEIKEYEKNQNNKITILNTLRRIIENYFSILGGYNMKFDKICEPNEKIIFDSLISFIHEGSHSINDNLYIDTQDEPIDKYLEVFKKIFEKTDNYGHYKMMMQE